jgi:hypothetical protein
MKWLRCLFLALSIGLAGFLARPERVEANSPQQMQGHTYYVYYRVDPNSPWVCYGYTQSYNDAQWYANWIYNTYGYESFVR